MRNSFNEKLIFQQFDKIPILISQDLNRQFVEDLYKLLLEKYEVKQLIDDLNEKFIFINEKNYIKSVAEFPSFDEFWEDLSEIYSTLEELFEKKNQYKQSKSKLTNCHIDEDDYTYINFAFNQFVLFIFDRVLHKKPYISITFLSSTPDSGKEFISILGINEFISEDMNLGNGLLQLLYKYIFDNEQYIYDFLMIMSNKLYFNLHLDKYHFSDGTIFTLSDMQKDKIKQCIKNMKFKNNDVILQLIYLLDLNKDMNYKLLKKYVEHEHDNELFIRPHIKSIISTFSEEEIDMLKSYVVIGELL